MRLLLDTQIALWALTGSTRLGILAQGLIEVRSNLVYAAGGTNVFFYTYGASIYSRIQHADGTFAVLDNRDLHPVTSVRWIGTSFRTSAA